MMSLVILLAFHIVLSNEVISIGPFFSIKIFTKFENLIKCVLRHTRESRLSWWFAQHNSFIKTCTSPITLIYDSFQKSRIRETKHISTDADSSTNTTVGWTKNCKKPNFFFKRKKSFKTQKL